MMEKTYKESLIRNALSQGGHYRAVEQCQIFKITGNRYANTKTPDIVRDLWSTPREVVEWMELEYGAYDLDAAASEQNKVCERFFSEGDDCLNQSWGSGNHVWLNPPYSNPSPFVKKSIEQSMLGNQVDMLLPADNSTAWFFEAQKHAAEIIWIVGDVFTNDNGVEMSRTGRLAFTNALTGKAVQGNNKGSVIIIFRKIEDGEKQITRYVSISEICPSVENKKPRKRSL